MLHLISLADWRRCATYSVSKVRVEWLCLLQASVVGTLRFKKISCCLQRCVFAFLSCGLTTFGSLDLARTETAMQFIVTTVSTLNMLTCMKAFYTGGDSSTWQLYKINLADPTEPY